MLNKDLNEIKLLLNNFETILENTNITLNNQINKLISNNYKIKKYEDKNSHLTEEIKIIGYYLMGTKYYELAEKYWDNITIKTTEFSDGKFNCGLSLANTGVSQMNGGKNVDGIHKIYLAYEDDKRILEQYNIRNIDVGKELINSILYTQFFTRVIDYFFDEVILEVPGPLPLEIDKDRFLNIPNNIKSLTAVQLFLILSELKKSIELFRDNNNFISRSKIMTSLFDLCLWIESSLREKHNGGNLCDLLIEELGIEIRFNDFLVPNIDWSTIDGLYKNIKNSLEMEDNPIVGDARLLRLIRNYTGHNLSLQNHCFFNNINEYILRILRLLVQCI